MTQKAGAVGCKPLCELECMQRIERKITPVSEVKELPVVLCEPLQVGG